MKAAERQMHLIAWLRKHHSQYGHSVGEIFYGMLFHEPKVYGMGPHLERDLRHLEDHGKVTRFDEKPYMWKVNT